MSQVRSALTRTAYDARSSSYWLREFSPTVPGTTGWNEPTGSLGAPFPFTRTGHSITVPAIPSGAVVGPWIVTGPTTALFSPPTDDLRGGTTVLVTTRTPLVSTRADALLEGAVLPSGWSSSATGSGTVVLTDFGPLLDTGSAGNSSAQLTLTAGLSLPDQFDLAVDIAPMLPAAAPSSALPVVVAVLEFRTAGGALARVGLKRGLGPDPARLYGFGETAANAASAVVPGGLAPAPLISAAIPATAWTLRLVRVRDCVYGFVGLRAPSAWTGAYFSSVQVLGSSLGAPLPLGPASQLVLRVANGPAGERILTQAQNYTVRSNARIGGQLLQEPRRDLNAFAISGIVPPAPVSMLGAVPTEVFGIFGTLTQTDAFVYTLPSIRTVSRTLTQTAFTISDPALRDGSGRGPTGGNGNGSNGSNGSGNIH